MILLSPTPQNKTLSLTAVRRAGHGLSVSEAAGTAAAGKWWPSVIAPSRDAVWVHSSTAASTGLCLASPTSGLAAQASLGKLNFKSSFGPFPSPYPGKAGWRGRQDQEVPSFKLKHAKSVITWNKNSRKWTEVLKQVKGHLWLIRTCIFHLPITLIKTQKNRYELQSFTLWD